jgi:MraZ protein
MPFVSYFERTLDEKNRVQIPSEFRSRMDSRIHGDAFILCHSPTTLSLYPVRTWEKLVARLQAREIDDDQAIDFEKWFHAMSHPLDMDTQGRVVLPKGHLESAKLGKEITLSGANNRIDIWRTEEFRQFAEPSQREWPNRKKFMRMLSSGWKDPDPSSTA